MVQHVAFLVGIERYDQPGWDVSGPCRNAIRIAEHLIGMVESTGHIHLLVNLARADPDDDQLKSKQAALDALKARGVNVYDHVNRETIDTAFRNLRSCKGRLLFYWSGHGYADNSGNRIFICPDYRSDGFANRIFNATRRFDWLHSGDFAGLTEQILLADVCAKHTRLALEEDAVGSGRRLDTIRQVGLFATPEGAYAYVDDGSGVFTDLLLGAFRKFDGWPDLKDYYEVVKAAAFAVKGSLFVIAGFEHQEQLPDTYAGTPSGKARATMPRIANYVAACGAFDALLSPACEQRILLVKGETGFGKSLLVIERAKLIPKDITQVSVKLAPSYHIAKLLSHALSIFGYDNLPCFVAGLKAFGGPLRMQISARVPFGWAEEVKLELARNGPDKIAALIECLFQDMATLPGPILFILDDFQESSPELRNLIEEHFLSFIARTTVVRAIIAGRILPDHTNIEWANCCAPICSLAGVHQAADWMPIVKAMRRRIGHRDPESYLGGICDITGGHPDRIMKFIQGLPEESPS
jgi:hypothetical protein